VGQFKQFFENVEYFRKNPITDEGLLQYDKEDLFSLFMQLNAILRSGDLDFDEQAMISQNISTIKQALNG
jgi:hypothetical protein